MNKKPGCLIPAHSKSGTYYRKKILIGDRVHAARESIRKYDEKRAK